jgi:superoxide dismutase, Cu-Zn family
MQSDSRGDTLKRITKAALGGLAGCALVLGGTQAATSAVEYFPYPEEELVDLPAPGPFDGASATMRLKVSGTGTNFKLEVNDIATSAEGDVFGAHLHTYACDEVPPPGEPGAGQLGGPHYNDEVVVGGKAFPKPGEVPSETIAKVSSETEVWFSFVPNAHGDATDDATVPFVPVDPDSKMSIVVHLLPTNTDPLLGPVGGAGLRQACFPLSVSGVFPTG